MRKKDIRKVVDEDTQEPCAAVQLLLKRMDSNPSEFNLKRGSMWADVLSLCRQRLHGTEDDQVHLVVLRDFEIKMIWEKFVETGRGELNKEFMRRILVAGDDEDCNGK